MDTETTKAWGDRRRAVGANQEIARLREAAREVVAAQTEDETNAAIFKLGQFLALTG